MPRRTSRSRRRWSRPRRRASRSRRARKARPPSRGSAPALEASAERDRGDLAALLALDRLDDHPLAFLKVGKAGAHQRRAVDEHVLAAVLDGDEAEALGGIVPFDGAGLLLGGRAAEAGTAAAARAWAAVAVAEAAAGGRTRVAEAAAAAATEPAATATAEARPRRLRRRGVDLEDLGHLRALLALRGADDELGAGLHLGLPGGLDDAHVQEGVAGAVGHLDEAEALLGVEPFDRRVLRRPGGDRRARRHRRGFAPTGLRLIAEGGAAVVAEVVAAAAATRSTKVSIAVHRRIQAGD